MGEIINVSKIVECKKVELKERVNLLKQKGIIPKLAVISANHDEASKSYIRNKRKMCEELGLSQEEYVLREDITLNEVLKLVSSLNNDKSVHAILLQLPIYPHLDENKILMEISPKKDVDGFHPLNLGKLLIGTKGILPCTPKGIITILDSLNIDYAGKVAVVVGRSKIVGKPVSQLLLNKDCTVITCHSKTNDLKQYTKTADILVVATGIPHLITSDMVKEDSIIIDVGINRVNGKIVGDVDTQEVLKKVKYITPVPKGVGLTTVLSLMENVVYMAESF